MKKFTKSALAILIALGGALQMPVVQQFIANSVKPLIATHPHIAAAIATVSAILALIHQPSTQN